MSLFTYYDSFVVGLELNAWEAT